MSTVEVQNVPESMRAMVLTGHGGMDCHEYRSEWPVPKMTPEQVLIKAHARCLNNTDVSRRSGWYSKAVSDATSSAIAGPIVSLDLRDLSFYGCTVTALNVFPDLVGYIERGEIRPVLASTWPLEKLVEAQTAFIAKTHVGNIVISMHSV